MGIRVVTDSSTNVPDSYLSQLKIVELPALVNFGAESFLNKVEITAEQFYRRLTSSDKLPTTSQPTPQHFATAYARLAAEGADEIIAVTVSSKLSGTHSSAVGGVEGSPVKVHVWDSLNASLGAGWQAIAAAEMAAEGLPAAEILARLAPIRARMCTTATPATLRYLVAGGRAPKLKGNIGELLDIKPILAVVDGLLDPVGQARGRRKALAELVNRAAEAAGKKPARVAITHANALDEATQVAESLRGRLDVREQIIADIGPVLATLGGPGIIVVCLYTLEA